MPHCIAEYSPALTEKADSLAADIHRITMASGLFQESAIKVRLIPVSHSLVAGKPAEQLAVTLRIMPGRNDLQKKTLADALLQGLSGYGYTVTAEILDLDKDCYSK